MQLSKRTIIILSSVLAAAAIAAAVVWYRSRREAQPQENVVLNEHPTDGAFYECDIPSADPLIVGRWNKKGKELREFSTMDVKEMFIAKIYIVKYSSRDSLVYYEKDFERDIFRFAKEQ